MVFHHYHLHLLAIIVVLMWVPYSGKAQVSINVDNMDVGSMHHLYPFDFNSFPKPQDLADDVSVQRVVTILHGNIKQWSFIESQLLEPNVNLGMPEIFIPLRHLTTTLEVLGKILFMKNDLTEAKACLERACPLMELLPSDQNHYATTCFSLLREVYNNFYGPDGKGPPLHDKDDSNQVIEIDMEVDIALEGSPHNLEDFDFDQNNEDDEYNNSNSGRRRSRFNDSKGKSGESYSSDRYNKLDDPDSSEPFDVESRLEQLRSPYEHLRAELHEKVQNGKPNQKLLGEPTTIQPSSSTTKRGKIENYLKASNIPNQFQQPRRKPLKLTDPDEIMFPAYMYESSYDGRLLRLKTKFDNVLRRFVLEGTKDSRQVVMRQAEDLLEEFYISIEDASVEAGYDLKEFNEIMDLGNAFLEMLSKATIDFEFSFIIEDIKAIGLDAEYMLNGEETIEHTNHLAPFDRSRAIVLKAVGRALHYMILPHETTNFDQYSNGLHTPYGHDTEASAALFDQTTSSIPSGHRSAVPTLKGDMKIATNIMLFFIFCIICLIASNQYHSPPRKGKVRSRNKSHNKTFLDTVQALFVKQAARDSDDEDNNQSKTVRKNNSFKSGDKVGSSQYGSKSLIDHVIGLAKIFMSSIRGTTVNGKSSKRKEPSKLTKPKKVKSEKADKSSNGSKNGSSKLEESKSTSDAVDSVKSNSSDESYDEGQDSDEINMSGDDYEAVIDSYDGNVMQIAPVVMKPEKPESFTEVLKVAPSPQVKKVEFSAEPKQTPSSIAAPTLSTLKPALKQTAKHSSAPASATNVTTSKKNSGSNVQEKTQPVQSTPIVAKVEAPVIKEVEKNPVVEVKATETPIIQPATTEIPILGLNVENDAVLNTEYDVFSNHSNFSILQPSNNSNLPILNEEDEEDNLLFLSTQLSTAGITNSGLGGLWELFAPAPATKVPADNSPLNGSLNGVYDRGLSNPSAMGSGLDIPISSTSSYMSSFDQNFQTFISPQMNAYSNDPMRMDYNGLSNVGLNSNEQPSISSLSFDLVTDLSANAPSFSPFTGGNFDPLLQNHPPVNLLNGLNSNADTNKIASGYFAPPPGLSDFNDPERVSLLNFSSTQDEKENF